jgi:hypothetical protein
MINQPGINPLAEANGWHYHLHSGRLKEVIDLAHLLVELLAAATTRQVGY